VICRTWGCTVGCAAVNQCCQKHWHGRCRNRNPSAWGNRAAPITESFTAAKKPQSQLHLYPPSICAALHSFLTRSAFRSIHRQTAAKMPRQFFVGGNFKMNGTIQSIKDIIKNLNEAKVDPNVGTLSPILTLPFKNGLPRRLSLNLASECSAPPAVCPSFKHATNT